MRKPREFNKYTFKDGYPILQPATPTDSDHQAHWWQTDDGQRILVAQNNFFDRIKAFENADPDDFLSKIGIQQHLNTITNQLEWPDVSSRDFWKTEFGLRIQTEFWEVANKFIRYLNTLG